MKNNYKYRQLDAAVIGSGAAGFASALRLYENGVRNFAVVTEGVNCGTSRNTGSDKQTYYKINLCGTANDSPVAMAEDLFSYGCTDGDIALCEAANSAECFIKLCNSGVPFPTNSYGEYVGYRTDHDERARATSAGPLTSKMMTECLERACREKNIEIIDGETVADILTENDCAAGFVSVNENDEITVFECSDVILATGGPAGIYNNTVYPEGHTGSNGIAFSAGAYGKNLTLWQFGLSSIKPRWNVSGTYMQSLPLVVSIDEKGNEYDVLAEYFSDSTKAMMLLFRKGYEWPFDSRKVRNGSSLIDLIVYRETVILGRKVFLDYRRNPFGYDSISEEKTGKEAYEYLKNTNALSEKPIERLREMNEPAYELYLSKGVDLEKEMLPIAVCAQHNNGGADVDCNWQTNIKGLYVAGEAAGTHGIYRPGGSALNAGQVGAKRAAVNISLSPNEYKAADFSLISRQAVEKIEKMLSSCSSSEDNLDEKISAFRKKADECAGILRDENALEKMKKELEYAIGDFENIFRVKNKKLVRLVKIREMLISQYVYVSAMLDYIRRGGKTSGSALYYDKNGEALTVGDNEFRFIEDDGKNNDIVQLAEYKNGNCSFRERKVRPIPCENEAFEVVWKKYRMRRQSNEK